VLLSGRKFSITQSSGSFHKGPFEQKASRVPPGWTDELNNGKTVASTSFAFTGASGGEKELWLVEDFLPLVKK